MSESLYIVMPAYNEKDNVKSIVEAWYPILDSKNETSRQAMYIIEHVPNLQNPMILKEVYHSCFL